MRPLKHSHRDGFTLIELLTVIGIMSLMMTLSVGTYFGFIASAKEAATRATILKVNRLIQDRVRAFRQYDFSDAAQRFADAKSLTVEVAEVLVRKIRMKQAIPQSFSEADFVRLIPQSLFPDAFSLIAPYDFPNFSARPAYQDKYECGIVLHAMLTRGETFGAPSAGDDAFTGSEIRVGPETNNLPCLVDAWGEPLRFYRWPTRLIRCGEFHLDDTIPGPPVHYDDYNQNGSPESAGITTGVFPPTGGTPIVISPIIRPTESVVALSGPTPASLLISNLPPFDRSSSYALGSDKAPGAQRIDDDGNGTMDWTNAPTNTIPDPGEVGYPDSDDPESLNTDPDDPSYRLSSWLENLTNQTLFLSYHDFYTFHTPLIVSAGPDKLLGLGEPKDTANFGHLAAPIIPIRSNLVSIRTTAMSQLSDNITNLNQRAGGK